MCRNMYLIPRLEVPILKLNTNSRMELRRLLWDETISFFNLLGQISSSRALNVFWVEIVFAANPWLIIDDLGYRRVTECLQV